MADPDARKDAMADPGPSRPAPYPAPPAAARRRLTVGHLVAGLLALIVLVVALAARRDASREVATAPPPDAAAPAAATAAAADCAAGPLPAEGGIRVIDPTRMRRTDALFAGLQIDNRHHHDVVAMLTDEAGGRPLMGLAVPAGRTLETGVPVGRYGLHFFAGSAWCNDRIGFRDGRRVNLAGGLDIEAGATAVLTLAPDGPDAPERFSISLDRRLPQPAPEQVGAGYVELRQQADGHYRVNGSVNGHTLTFVVDTGATLTALSEDMAAGAGLAACTPATFRTANGQVEGCVARAAELAFGGFVLRDVEVAIMPDLAGDALLGMNALRRFRVEQQNGSLRIAVR